MASGVNSTFRQVGIATGIAALGSIFAHQVTNGIHAAPGRYAGSEPADPVSDGRDQRPDPRPSSPRRRLRPGAIEQAATGSFVDALNLIITIAAVIALVAGICCLFLIRPRTSSGTAATPRPSTSPPAGTGPSPCTPAERRRARGQQQLEPDDVPEEHDQGPEHPRRQPAAEVRPQPAADQRAGRDQHHHRPVEGREEHEHDAGGEVGREHRDVLEAVDRLEGDVEPQRQDGHQQHALGGAEVAAVHPDQADSRRQADPHLVPVAGPGPCRPAAPGGAASAEISGWSPTSVAEPSTRNGTTTSKALDGSASSSPAPTSAPAAAVSGDPDHEAPVARQLAPEAERAGHPARHHPDVVADVRDQRGQPDPEQDREAHQRAGADRGHHEARPEAGTEDGQDLPEIHPVSRAAARRR